MSHTLSDRILFALPPGFPIFIFVFWYFFSDLTHSVVNSSAFLDHSKRIPVCSRVNELYNIGISVFVIGIYTKYSSRSNESPAHFFLLFCLLFSAFQAKQKFKGLPGLNVWGGQNFYKILKFPVSTLFEHFEFTAYNLYLSESVHEYFGKHVDKYTETKNR